MEEKMKNCVSISKNKLFNEKSANTIINNDMLNAAKTMKSGVKYSCKVLLINGLILFFLKDSGLINGTIFMCVYLKYITEKDTVKDNANITKNTGRYSVFLIIKYITVNKMISIVLLIKACFKKNME